MKKQVYQSPCTEVSVIESSILCSSPVPRGGGTLESIGKQQGSWT